jgi:glucans biosynthesis protein
VSVLLLLGFLWAGPAQAQDPKPGFAMSDVAARAQSLAREPYREPTDPPRNAAELDYDSFRRITFIAEQEDFRASDRARLRYFPRGSIYTDPVTINIIRNGTPTRRDYSPSDFRFYDLPLSEEDKVNLGFAGFRLTAPLNRPGKFDEVLSFLGASYFRALGAGTVYGTSARGLALGTASEEGEEFPRFTEFWIEEPRQEDRSIRLFALMDSPSLTGAFRFDIRPGVETRMDVEAAIFPRRTLTRVGVAPLSSMFEFAPQDPLTAKRDFRPAVHDAEGLAVHLANGERLWRPLVNPRDVEISSFAERVPQSFALEQRSRSFDDYSDLEARYERRPSVIIEPGPGWESGQLVLVEIPTTNEFNDNIVAFWQPKEPWEKGERQDFGYRITWSGNTRPAAVAAVSKTRIGREIGGERPLVVIDFETGAGLTLEDLRPEVSTSNGSVKNVNLQQGDGEGAFRLSFVLDRSDTAAPAELRAFLMTGEERVSETWLYRWTAL